LSGISGFGGVEAMRLVASHPSFELIYAAGEGSAGSRLVDRFPDVPAKLAELVIEKWDPVTLPKLDVLFASLPTGASVCPDRTAAWDTRKSAAMIPACRYQVDGRWQRRRVQLPIILHTIALAELLTPLAHLLLRADLMAFVALGIRVGVTAVPAQPGKALAPRHVAPCLEPERPLYDREFLFQPIEVARLLEQ
jgi:hypothetical protein